MKIIKVPKNTIERDHTVYKTGKCGHGRVPVKPLKEIIFPKDIPAISVYGPGQIRPDGDRSPQAEMYAITDIMNYTNGFG